MSVLHICKPIFQRLHKASREHACGAVSSDTLGASPYELEDNRRSLATLLRREFNATKLEAYYTYEGQERVDLGMGELEHLFKEKDFITEDIKPAETAYIAVNHHVVGWDQGQLWSRLAEQALLDRQETFIGFTPVDIGGYPKGGYEFKQWQYDESGIPIPTKFLGPMKQRPELEESIIEYMLSLKSSRQISKEKESGMTVAYKLYAHSVRPPYGWASAMGDHARYKDRKRRLTAMQDSRS